MKGLDLLGRTTVVQVCTCSSALDIGRSVDSCQCLLTLNHYIGSGNGSRTGIKISQLERNNTAHLGSHDSLAHSKVPGWAA